jgi:16S rRNA (cytosine967-C5)-methyltransferase
MERGPPAMTASPQNKSSPTTRTRKSARAIAFSILLDVETKAAFASELLHSRLSRETDAREAALATELVMGTLRWQRTLDFLLERYTKRGAAKLDAEVRIALRMGIYQLRHLQRIPARAAVNESVELARRARKSSAAALVNAVLRRVSAEKDKPLADFLSADLQPAERLAIEHSHPPWMVERWLRKFGQEETIQLLEWNNRAPALAISIVNPSRRGETVELLRKTGFELTPGHLLKDAALIRKGNVTSAPEFQHGSITIQDEASQMVPLLLHVKAGDSVLDLCAAPGGKTLVMARLAGANALVVACDIHESRLRAMRERLQSAGVKNAHLIALDGTRALPFANKFDRILVDAPCSGTGTLARNPEIRWRLRAEDLAALHSRQVALLTSALNFLAEGGRLIYSTCSLESEENELVVAEALAANSEFRTEPAQIPEEGLAEGVQARDIIDDNGAFRTFPPTHHTDGFLAVAIRRR